MESPRHRREARREAARRKYRPKHIKYLIIVESPPEAEERFFYYPDVDDGDILYAELMRAIFPKDGTMLDIDTLRGQKRAFLKDFAREGFYLIDALDEPLPQKMKSRERRKKIKKKIPYLLGKIWRLRLDGTGAKVIIIKATVHHEVYAELKLKGLNVVNDKPISFPGRFTRKKFREQMAATLASCFERPADWPYHQAYQ